MTAQTLATPANRAEIIGVHSYETGKDYYWVTFQGKTEILEDRKEAIARGLELNPEDCTLRFQ